MTDHESAVIGRLTDQLAAQGAQLAALVQQASDVKEFNAFQFSAIRLTLQEWGNNGFPQCRDHKQSIRDLWAKIGEREGEGHHVTTSEFDLSMKGLHWRNLKPRDVIITTLAIAVIILAFMWSKARFDPPRQYSHSGPRVAMSAATNHVARNP